MTWTAPLKVRLFAWKIAIKRATRGPRARLGAPARQAAENASGRKARASPRSPFAVCSPDGAQDPWHVGCNYGRGTSPTRDPRAPIRARAPAHQESAHVRY